MKAKRIISFMLSILMLLSSLTTVMEIFAYNSDNTDNMNSKQININDTIELGRYYGEPITWRCVAIDENGPLMLSDKILCFKAFDAKGSNSYYHKDSYGNIRSQAGSNNWQDSNIRQWLNTYGKVNYFHCPPNSTSIAGGHNAYDEESGFLSSFSPNELLCVKETTNIVNINEYDKLRSGYCDGGSTEIDCGSVLKYSANTDFKQFYYKNVTDRVFLLTTKQVAEVRTYCNDAIQAYATSQALNNNTDPSFNKGVDVTYPYWLNSPGTLGASYEHVNTIPTASLNAAYYCRGIRPAFYLNNEEYDKYKAFNQNIYTANYYLENESARNLIDSMVNATSPSVLQVNCLSKNFGFGISQKTWELLHLIDDPSKINSKYGIGKIQYYESVLFSLVQQLLKKDSKDYVNLAYLSTCENYTSIITTSLNIGNDKYLPNDKKIKLNEMVRNEELGSILKSYGEKYDMMTSILYYIDDISEIIEIFALIDSLSNVCEGIEIAMKQLADNTTDPALRAAALNVANACNDGIGATMQYAFSATNVLVDWTMSYASEALWEKVTKSHPFIRAAKYGMKLGTALSDLLFNSSDFNEKYYAIKCISEIEKSFLSAMNSSKNLFLTEKNECYANAYTYSIYLLYQTKIMSCDFAIDFLKASKDDGVLFRNQSEYLTGKSSFEFCKAAYKRSYYLLSKIWCFGLKEDYPELYELMADLSLGIFQRYDISDASIVYFGRDNIYQIYLDGMLLVENNDYKVVSISDDEQFRYTTISGIGQFTGSTTIKTLIHQYKFDYNSFVSLKNNSRQIRSSNIQMQALGDDETDIETIDGLKGLNVSIVNNGEYLLSVKNGKIADINIPMIVSTDEITFLLDDEYDIEITSEQDINVDLSFNDNSGYVNYNSLDFVNGSMLVASVENNNSKTVMIDGNEIKSDYDSNSDQTEQYNVVVNGGISSSSKACAGDKVFLTADERDESVFAYWFSNSSMEINNSDSLNAYFIMPNHDVEVTAVFDQCEHCYGTIIYESDCVLEGYTLYVCSYCGYSYVEDVQPLIEHSYTYSVESSTPNTRGRSETVCTKCIDAHYEILPYDTDKSALESAINTVKFFEEKAFSHSSYSKMKEKYQICNAIISEDVAQVEIDKAITELLESQYELEPYLCINVFSQLSIPTVAYGNEIYTDKSHIILYGTEVVVSAPDVEGYKFYGWIDNKSKRILSTDNEYTFFITTNLVLEAMYVPTTSTSITFANDSGQITSVVTKTIDEWNAFETLDSILPNVPYSYGKVNGRWDYNCDDVLAKLKSGEDVTIIAIYDVEQEIEQLKPKNDSDDAPVANLTFDHNQEQMKGSFIMCVNIPEKCKVNSIGIAFYYGKVNTFNPTEMMLTLNNKNIISQFGTDVIDDIYIVNTTTNGYNWASVGYITYFDAGGNLVTYYTNQVNVVDNEWFR